MKKPLPTVTPNTWEFLRDPMIKPTGFREYDARWKYPNEINLPGMTALGLGLGREALGLRGLVVPRLVEQENLVEVELGEGHPIFHGAREGVGHTLLSQNRRPPRRIAKRF